MKELILLLFRLRERGENPIDISITNIKILIVIYHHFGADSKYDEFVVRTDEEAIDLIHKLTKRYQLCS